MSGEIHLGHVMDVLPQLPDECCDCCVTSPPYYRLRDYGLEPRKWLDGWVGCLGLEPTPDQYVSHLVDVFGEVWRVLKPQGTLWVVIGDSYNSSTRWSGGSTNAKAGNTVNVISGNRMPVLNSGGLKEKDLMGIPWALATALRSDGWYLRSDIIWHKPNAMPGSQKDRPTNAHEHIFLLSKNPQYYYDHEAVKSPAKEVSIKRRERADLRTKSGYDDAHFGNPPMRRSDKQRGHSRRHDGFNDHWDQLTKAEQQSQGATLRDVWTVATKPYPDPHFAVYPTTLIEPCIKAGCPEGGVVLDPFFGAGTTGLVAHTLGRNFIGIELSQPYMAQSYKRLRKAGAQVTLV